MASLDIGIDLGTSCVLAMDSSQSVLVREPAVVAVDTRTDQVRKIGAEVYKMIGRTPPHIQVIHPLADGVISDFELTEVLIKHILKKVCSNPLVKPRVSICVPSGITGVESQAVINAALSAGARKVYLIEEPVAAAIGAGVELARPNGNLIVDIGCGTADVAVLSLNGIVCKSSAKHAGARFDQALIRHIRTQYGLLIGEKTAEQIKMDIGSVWPESEEASTVVKGRDLLTGLPKKISLCRSETVPVLTETAEHIARCVQGVLEKTPPELAGDIRDNGFILTGGGALLNGLDRFLESKTNIHCVIADNPLDCVAIGTAKSFQYLNKLFDGFITPSTQMNT